MRGPFQRQGLSKSAIDIIVASWRAATTKQYHTYIKQWKEFCAARNISYLQSKVETVVEFLSELYYGKHLGYSAINTARSALSSFLVLDDNLHSVGTHPLVSRLMKGIFQLRPPRPRYKEIWDVNVVFAHLRKLAPSNVICLKDLTMKVCILIALISAQRVQSLLLLNLKNMVVKANSIVFTIDDH